LTVPYYVYRYEFGAGTRENPKKVYVGQSRAAERALIHLSDSSNEQLKEEMKKAKEWPSIEFVKLAYPCLGDLQIAESLLIKVEFYRAEQSKAFKCLNGRSEAGSGWFKDAENDQLYPKTILSAPDGDKLAYLKSYPFCNSENGKVVKKAARAAFKNGHVGSSLKFLPRAGDPIEVVGRENIRKRLDEEKVSRAIIVKISDKTLDQRDPIHLGSKPKDIGDRCLKFWKTPSKELEKVNVLIAVIGQPNFRIIIGAWRISGYDHSDGIFTAKNVRNANFAGLRGCVLDSKIRFQQSAPMVMI